VGVDEVNNGLPRILGRTLYEHLYCGFLFHLWKQEEEGLVMNDDVDTLEMSLEE